MKNHKVQPDKLEKLIALCSLSDEDYLQKVRSSFDEKLVNNNTVWEIIVLADCYYQEYKKLPPRTYITQQLEDRFELMDELRSIEFDCVTHKEWLLKETDEYLKTNDEKQKVLDRATILDNDNLDIETKQKKIKELNDRPCRTLFQSTKPFKILNIEDFRNDPHPPREVLLNPWFLQYQYLQVIGEMNTGKSPFCLSLCFHLATQTKFFLWEPNRRVKCLYIDGEMTWWDITERLGSFPIEDYPDIKDYLYYYSTVDQEDAPNPVLTNQLFRDYIEKFCVVNGIEVVVFDNRSSLAPGLDENVQTTEWDMINSWFIHIKGLGINPVVVLHKGKNTKGARGHSSQMGNNDVTIELYSPSGHNKTGDCEFNMRFHKLRTRLGTNEKYWYMRFAPCGDGKFEWFGKDTTNENVDMFIALAIHNNVPQKDIGTKYNIDKSAVSRKKVKLIDMGYLGKDGKLTNHGKLYVSDVEEMYYENEQPILLDQVENGEVMDPDLEG